MNRIVAWIGLCSLLMSGAPAWAQDEGPDLPAEVIAAVGGEAVAEALGDGGFAALSEACPFEDVGEVVTCLKSNADAKAIIEAAAKTVAEEDAPVDADPEPDGPGAGALEADKNPEGNGVGDAPSAAEKTPTEYPAEALALLPREALDEFPKLITHFLKGADYVALKKLCPQDAVADVVACITADENILDTALERRVVASMLDLMDVTLAPMLEGEGLDLLAALCDEPGGKWGDCVWKHGVGNDACEEQNDALARCIVGDDLVGEAYQEVQRAKKAVFGPDMYVEMRGLLSQLDLEAIAGLRERCPQTDHAKLVTCLETDPLIGEILAVFTQVADEVVAGANKELGEVGKALTEEQTETYVGTVLEMLLTFPIHTVASLGGQCEKKLGKAKLTSVADMDAQIACFQELSSTDPVSNPAFIARDLLAKWLGKAREKVIEKVRAKEAAAQGQAFMASLYGMLGLTVFGLLFILLLPLIMRKKLAGAGSSAWRASGLAAVTFVATMAVLAGTLLLMRTVQGGVATDWSSPKMRVAMAVFDVLEKPDYVGGFSELSKERLDFVKTPLRSIITTAEVSDDQSVFAASMAEHWSKLLEQPEVKRVAKNASRLAEHAKSYRSVFGFYRKISWFLGIFPVLLGLLAVLLYLIPMRQTLLEIATSPLREGRGDGEGPLDTVKGELKLVGPFLLTILIVLPLTGLFIALAIQPVVQMLIDYSVLAVFYLVESEASVWVLYGSLGATILLLVLTLVLYLMLTIFLIGVVRKILRARFHWGHPMARYKDFFRKGLPAAAAVLAYPAVFSLLMWWLGDTYLSPSMEGELTTSDMVALPLTGLVLFPLLFWLGRGLKAMGYIAKYKVVQDPSEAGGA